MFKKVLVTIMVGIMSLGTACLAWAGDGESVVKAKLAMVVLLAKSKGMEVEYLDIDTLNKGDIVRYKHMLPTKFNHVSTAVAADDSEDLDLYLVNPLNGDILMKDVENDSTPVLEIKMKGKVDLPVVPLQVVLKMARGHGYYGYVVLSSSK
jgi:hypothetical protein